MTPPGQKPAPSTHARWPLCYSWNTVFTHSIVDVGHAGKLGKQATGSASRTKQSSTHRDAPHSFVRSLNLAALTKRACTPRSSAPGASQAAPGARAGHPRVGRDGPGERPRHRAVLAGGRHHCNGGLSAAPLLGRHRRRWGEAAMVMSSTDAGVTAKGVMVMRSTWHVHTWMRPYART